MGKPLIAFVAGADGIIWRGRPSIILGLPILIKGGLLLLAIFKGWNYLLRLTYYNFPELFLTLRKFDSYISILYGLIAVVSVYQLIALMLTEYELSSERLLYGRGVFSRVTDQLELYRVRDYTLLEPFHLRIFGLSNILIVSSDRTNPRLMIQGISNGREVLQLIRDRVEQQRRANPATDFDVVGW